MIYEEYRPSPAVEALVERYWHLRRPGAPAWEPIYPDGCCEVIFNLGEAADERRGERVVRQPQHFVYGQIDRRIEVRGAPETAVLAIRLRPWGASALLEAPGAALAGRSVPLDALSPALAGRLLPIVEDQALVAAKVARLDAALCEWIQERVDALPPTASVARYLLERPTSTVDEMSWMTGWSARTLERRFRADVGLPPKRFLQITRFLRFLRLLELEPATPLPHLAVAAGYYDQPHLHRDLRRFTGSTPAGFRSRSETTFDRLYGPDRLARLVAL